MIEDFITPKEDKKRGTLVESLPNPCPIQSYTHTQINYSNIWEIKHNLDNLDVGVQVNAENSNKFSCIGDIRIIDKNTATIRFSNNTVGIARVFSSIKSKGTLVDKLPDPWWTPAGIENSKDDTNSDPFKYTKSKKVRDW